jgi:hypothetical protein
MANDRAHELRAHTDEMKRVEMKWAKEVEERANDAAAHRVRLEQLETQVASLTELANTKIQHLNLRWARMLSLSCIFTTIAIAITIVGCFRCRHRCLHCHRYLFSASSACIHANNNLNRCAYSHFSVDGMEQEYPTRMKQVAAIYSLICCVASLCNECSFFLGGGVYV